MLSRAQEMVRLIVRKRSNTMSIVWSLSTYFLYVYWENVDVTHFEKTKKST